MLNKTVDNPLFVPHTYLTMTERTTYPRQDLMSASARFATKKSKRRAS